MARESTHTCTRCNRGMFRDYMYCSRCTHKEGGMIDQHIEQCSGYKSAGRILLLCLYLVIGGVGSSNIKQSQR